MPNYHIDSFDYLYRHVLKDPYLLRGLSFDVGMCMPKIRI